MDSHAHLHITLMCTPPRVSAVVAHICHAIIDRLGQESHELYHENCIECLSLSLRSFIQHTEGSQCVLEYM